MNPPLFINVLFQPINKDGDYIETVSAYGETIGPVLGEGERRYVKAKRQHDTTGVINVDPPFNSTFVDVRRLRNLTKEQAEAIAKEWAIQIVPLPGSTAPSMGG